jgi:CheY-like chemotaxis protein
MSRVLVVDDTAVVARLLSVTLTLDGHEVTEVTDHFEQLLTPDPWQDVDVLVCDIRMPDISGVDVLNYCSDHCPDIFRVAITGSFDWSDETTRAAGSASDLLLRKPDDVHRLVDVLRENGA